MSYRETLIRIVKEDKEREQLFLNALSPDNVKNIADAFSRNRKYYALESWFIQNDLQQTKQYFSDIGVLDHFSRYPKLYQPTNSILPFIFCSDNTKVITAYCQLEQFREWGADGSAWSVYVNAAANAYLENYELLEEDCFYIKEYNKDRYGTDYIINFYKALMQGNVDSIQEHVELLGSEKYRKKNEVVTDLLPQYVMTEALNAAKLSWFKGYELNIESKYIPKDWLPIQPNEEYTIPYDFVKEHCLKHDLV